MTSASWTIFADGPVGVEVLRIMAQRHREAVTAIVVVNEPTAEIKNAFPAAQFLSWRQVQDAGGSAFAHKAEIVLLAWWPYVLRGILLDLGQTLMLNMHPSLLPYGRGKDPNFWGLASGEPLGVSIHHVDEAIDAGDIAFQQTLPQTWEDTGETVYLRSQAALVALFESVCDRISNFDVPRIPQDLAKGKFRTRAELEPASEITLDRVYSARALLNLLRARTFINRPSCWFRDDGKVYEASISIKERRGD